MKFGQFLPTYRSEENANGEAIHHCASTAEDMGYESLWVGDHIIIPEYRHRYFGTFHYSPIDTLAYAAGLTRKCLLGTSILVIPYHNPIEEAHHLACIDNLSGGRVVLGTGTGNLKEEYENLGLGDSYATRGARTDEYLAIYKELWTNDKPSFQGKFFSFSGCTLGPKPIQKPHIPVWIGGNTRIAMRRAIRLGAAWFPASPRAMGSFVESVKEFKQMKAQAGLGDGDPPVLTGSIAVRVRSESRQEGENRRPMWGSLDEVLGDVETFEKLGMTHMACEIISFTYDEHRKAAELFAEKVIPRFRN